MYEWFILIWTTDESETVLTASAASQTPEGRLHRLYVDCLTLLILDAAIIMAANGGIWALTMSMLLILEPHVRHV